MLFFVLTHCRNIKGESSETNVGRGETVEGCVHDVEVNDFTCGFTCNFTCENSCGTRKNVSVQLKHK